MTSPIKNSLAVSRATVMASLLSLVACGGGSGGGGDNSGPRYSRSSSSAVASSSASSEASSASSLMSSSSSPSGAEPLWTKGVFADSAQFESQCENPRTGIAPYDNLPYPDQQGSTRQENHYLRSRTNEIYLWYSEVPDLNPALHSTPDYFELMKTTAVTPTGTLKDQFHWSVPTEEYRKRSEAGVEAGYGAVWVTLSRVPPRETLVSYVQPNSPAAAAGLSRGARLIEIDGIDLVNDNTESGIATLNAGLFPSSLSESHTFKVRDLNDSSTRTVELTSSEITIAPTPTVKSFGTPSGRVGYLLFNSHIATAETALTGAVEWLRDQGVSDLVLDVRYNGGGYLDIANQLAYMVAGSNAAGKTFNTTEFNAKHRYFDPFTGAALMPTKFHTTTLGFSESAGQALPTLNLNRVFILTSGNTCSASEGIINGLRGIDVEVVLIGSATCGKPYGAYIVENCGQSYFTIQFKSANAQGYGEYSDGFFPGSANSSNPAELPGCLVPDDYQHALGDPNEARLAAAFYYRDTGNCPAVATANKSKSHLQKARATATSDGFIQQPPGLNDMILRR